MCTIFFLSTNIFIVTSSPIPKKSMDMLKTEPVISEDHQDSDNTLLSNVPIAFTENRGQLENNKVIEVETAGEPKVKGSITTPGLQYRVQFYTSPVRLQSSDKKFRDVPDVTYYEHNGLYKYTSGAFSDRKEAEAHLSRIREMGFGDAFVAAFKDNERITIREATKLESNR